MRPGFTTLKLVVSFVLLELVVGTPFALSADVGAPISPMPPSSASRAPSLNPAQKAAQTAMLPWSDQSHYQDCDQVCLQHRANELLTTQALYLGHKMSLLETVWEAALKPTPPDFSTLLTALHDYCPDLQGDTTSEPNAKSCLRRYVMLQIPVLRSIKSAIAQNNYAALQYRSDVATVTPDGKIVHTSATPAYQVSDETRVAKLPQTAYVPTLKQLDDQAAEDARLKKSVSPLFERWVQQMGAAHEPNPSDFYMWKSVPLDPNDLKGSKTSVLLRDSNGKPQIDKKAFDEAQRRYKDVMNDLQQAAKSTGPNDHSPERAPGDRAAYQEAYDDYVQQNNEELLQNQDKVKVIGAGARQPAQTSVYTQDFVPVNKSAAARATNSKAVGVQPLLTGVSVDHVDLTKSYSPDELDKEIGEWQNMVDTTLKP